MSIVYGPKLEWQSFPESDGTRRIVTRGHTTRGGFGRTDRIAISFTVDQVLEMIRNDPSAQARLLHHADLIRGAIAFKQVAAETIAKQEAS